MITQRDIDDMAPVTLELDTAQKNPTDWLRRMIKLADRGTNIIYSRGMGTDKIMQFMRGQGGVVFDGKNVVGKVALKQRRDHEGQTIYIAEVL